MEKKFKDTQIPELFTEQVTMQGYTIGITTSVRIATVLFDAASRYLAKVKNITTPQALVFKGIDNTFLAAAKIEYIKNDDDDDVSGGYWDYTWTVNEDDVKDANCVDFNTNMQVMTFFERSAINLFSMTFNDTPTAILLFTFMLDMIINDVKENTKDDEPYTLVLDGSFEAHGEVEDGKINISIIPSGDMKLIVKEDAAIQS